jgi:phospholipid/cholesterol/gamma-HCH transport system substrate-binding protein
MTSLNRLYSPPELSAPGKREAQARRRDLTLAGLFVLGMAVVVAAGMLWLAPGLFGGYPLRAYFLEADGLDTGMDVIMEGYTVGRVQSLEPVFRDARDRQYCPPPADPRAPALPCFRATLNIRGEWPIPVGSAVQLAPAGLLQGNILRIRPGTADTTLAPGSALATIAREPDLAAQIQTTLVQAQRTIDDTIRPTLVNIQDRVQSLLSMFGDGKDDGAGAARAGLGADVGQGLSSVVANLTQLSRDIEQSVDPEQIQAILGAVQTLSENLAAVSDTLPSRSADIREAVRQYGALADQISETVEATQPSLQSSLSNAEYALQELAAALAPILANIETASRNLSALSRELREDPVSLLRSREQEDPSPWFDR